jgi:hypothetical protein
MIHDRIEPEQTERLETHLGAKVEGQPRLKGSLVSFGS